MSEVRPILQGHGRGGDISGRSMGSWWHLQSLFVADERPSKTFAEAARKLGTIGIHIGTALQD